MTSNLNSILKESISNILLIYYSGSLCEALLYLTDSM